MLHIVQNSNGEDELQENSKTSQKTLDSKNSFNTLQPYFSFHHPRLWILLLIAAIQILLLLSFRSLPLSSPLPKLPPTSTKTSTINQTTYENGTTKNSRTIFPPPVSPLNNKTSIKTCPFGKVYMYELPPLFNKELIQNCSTLNIFTSRYCEALSNDGFGRQADGISTIIPKNLMYTWFWTDQFALELIHHNRMMNYRCRTLEPELATGFYIPFYVGLAVGKYLWSENFTANDRDQHCRMMLDWVRDQPYWNRSNGWDHFITMGRISWDFRRSKDRDWGSSCIYLPGMRNITRLLIERNPWDYFDVGVPYPTGFHPSSTAEVEQWQHFVRTRFRKTTFCFAGATRGIIKDDFRGLLLNHCRHEPGSCRVVDCGKSKCANGTSEILETFLDSDFCLQPRGDSFTRRSIFDCMVAGSIPVFFWRRTAYYQYEWFLPHEPESYSVFIDRHGVKNGTISIKDVLKSISRDKIESMREKVIEYTPRLIYAKPNKGLDGISDAFDIAVEGVLGRIKKQEGGYKW
ncbi:glycosyltransferase [Lithospermum erythrorhizon]|uniref:Glycosyltransferase n=1 Tax=Lithospermum erythrorhizon TaxID=34254 RepID=A0AAV3PLM5_LITER